MADLTVSQASTSVLSSAPRALSEAFDQLKAEQVQERRGYWRAVVAIAAKNARLAWAVLRHGEDFRLYPSAA